MRHLRALIVNWLLSVKRRLFRRLFRDVRQYRSPSIQWKLLCPEPLESRRVMAGMPELLADLSQYSDSIANVTQVGEITYFTASTTSTGKELWRLDTTSSLGATLVHDILPGVAGSDPENLINVGGTLYFVANDGESGRELWKSNGTSAGTTQVADIIPGEIGSAPTELTEVGGVLFFAANNEALGVELWKSNGTALGTVQVADLQNGFGSSSPKYLTNVSGLLYFTADDGVNGRELWKSNGTQAGTAMVKDIGLGDYPVGIDHGAKPRNLTNVGGTLYFSAQNETSGRELWKSNGTEVGTEMVADIFAGSYSSSVDKLINVAGVLYFTADDGISGVELWKSAGTAGSTELVADIGFDNSSSYPDSMVAVNNLVYFSANNESGEELWRSDGSAAGTVLVKDINAGSNSSYPYQLTNVGGKLYFAASTPEFGFELWTSDGSESGTVQVRDVLPGVHSSYPILTNSNGTLLFSATNASGVQLWTSQGTQATTTPKTSVSFASDVDSSPEQFTEVGDTTFFVARSIQGNTELWKTDGTRTNTVLVKDINPGVFGSYPTNLTNVGGVLYFTALNSETGFELWKSDGTQQGTVQIADIDPIGSSYPQDLTNVGGKLFFTADDGLNGRELWTLDGSTPSMVLDIANGTATSNPESLVDVGGVAYFVATSDSSGTELWKSDGTSNGTVQVKDINFDIGSSSPTKLTNVAGVLYFVADDGVHGLELWRSSGDAINTQLVTDVQLGTVGSDPNWLTNVAGVLFFAADDGTSGVELWKVGSNTSNAVQVKDITTGNYGSNPSWLTNVGGVMYFSANDGTTGVELWKSDGTASGTILVSDIQTGIDALNLPLSSYPSNLVNVAGTLFFAANDERGNELWKSDGSASGTVLTLDIHAGSSATGLPNSSNPSKLASASGILYFSANDGVHGLEPWSVSPNESPTDIVISNPYVPLGLAVGSTVATLNTVDSDPLDTHVYSLVTGVGDNDNAKFTIDGNVLKAAQTLNFTGTSVYSIRLRSTDDGGLFVEKQIQIRVIPVANNDDAPTIKNVAVTLNVLTNDSHPEGFNIEIVDAPPTTSGVLELQSDMTIRFVPANNFVGIASLTYRLFNGTGVVSNLATARFGVAATAKQNPWWNLDVDANTIVTPSDALRIINVLNDPNSVRLVGSQPAAAPYLDVTGDGRYTPSDALQVINHLNANRNGEGESTAYANNVELVFAFASPLIEEVDSLTTKKRSR